MNITKFQEGRANEAYVDMWNSLHGVEQTINKEEQKGVVEWFK